MGEIVTSNYRERTKDRNQKVERSNRHNNENEEVVNRKVSQNLGESDEDSRKMITRTARFSMNKEVAGRKKLKTCNEETLVVKLEKGN